LPIVVSGFFAKETVVKDYAEPVKEVIADEVTKIADGDTLTILNSDNKLVKIRLYGIDAPEKPSKNLVQGQKSSYQAK
jgi:endonuclease YncB( thermonuclease family)